MSNKEKLVDLVESLEESETTVHLLIIDGKEGTINEVLKGKRIHIVNAIRTLTASDDSPLGKSIILLGKSLISTMLSDD